MRWRTTGRGTAHSRPRCARHARHMVKEASGAAMLVAGELGRTLVVLCSALVAGLGTTIGAGMA